MVTLHICYTKERGGSLAILRIPLFGGFMRRISLTFVALAVLALAACATTTTPAPEPVAVPVVEAAPAAETPAPTPPPGPTVEEATRFANEAEARLAAMNVDAQRAAWVQATYITDDTQAISAKENEK